jgi:hypothetical protein
VKWIHKTLLTVFVLRAIFAFAMVPGALLLLAGLGIVSRRLPDNRLFMILFGAAILITGIIASIAVNVPKPGARRIRRHGDERSERPLGEDRAGVSERT